MKINIDVLRIELNAQEREEASNVVAIEFKIYEDRLSISELWESQEESWSDGVSVDIPKRIWIEAMPWINGRLK